MRRGTYHLATNSAAQKGRARLGNTGETRGLNNAKAPRAGSAIEVFLMSAGSGRSPDQLEPKSTGALETAAPVVSDSVSDPCEMPL